MTDEIKERIGTWTDVIIRWGTIAFLGLNLWFQTRYVTKDDFKEMETRVRTVEDYQIRQEIDQRDHVVIHQQLTDHENRIRTLEIRR